MAKQAQAKKTSKTNTNAAQASVARIDEPTSADLQKAHQTYTKAAGASVVKKAKKQEQTKAFAFPTDATHGAESQKTKAAKADKADKKKLTKKALKAESKDRLTKPGVILKVANFGLARLTQFNKDTQTGWVATVMGVEQEVKAVDFFPATKKQVDEYKRLYKMYVKDPVKQRELNLKAQANLKVDDRVLHKTHGLGIVKDLLPDGNVSVLFKGDDLAVATATGDVADPRTIPAMQLKHENPKTAKVAKKAKKQEQTKASEAPSAEGDGGAKKVMFEGVGLFGAFVHKSRTFVKVSKSNGIAAQIRGGDVEPFAMLATKDAPMSGSAVQRFKKTDKVELYTGN